MADKKGVLSRRKKKCYWSTSVPPPRAVFVGVRPSKHDFHFKDTKDTGSKTHKQHRHFTSLPMLVEANPKESERVNKLESENERARERESER